MSRYFLLSALCLLFLGTQAAAQSLEARVDKVFERFSKPGSPGCALGVIRNGELILSKGYGFANLEYGIPIDSKSVFRIGSTSKQFTAFAVQLLADEGKLSLDDEIQKYFPEIPRYPEGKITVRHLIHHTSGLRDYLTLMSLAGLRDDDFYTDAQVLDILSRQKELNFPPGDQFLYSNSGYLLLAILVERVSGQNLREFAHEGMFGPLGMNDTHFHNDHTHIVGKRASGYSGTDTGDFTISMTTLGMIGDGGVFTNLEDLLRWDQNFYKHRVGNAHVFDEMLRPGVLNDGEVLDYASGLFGSEYKGLKTVRHGGAFVGFRAELLRFPDQKFSVACLCNLAQTNPSHLADQVADIYLEDELRVTKDKARSPVTDDQETMSDYPAGWRADRAGFYEGQDGEFWEIAEDAGKLSLRFLSGQQIPLGPLDRNSWLGSQGRRRVRLDFSGSGFFTGSAPNRRRFESVQRFSPGRRELEEYLGSYGSSELDGEHNIELRGGKLYIRQGSPFRESPESELIPTTRDGFWLGGITIRFVREDGKVVGYRVSAGRVRNIQFTR